MIDKNFIAEFLPAEYENDHTKRVILEDVKPECLDLKWLEELTRECSVYEEGNDIGVCAYKEYGVRIARL